MQFPRDWLKRHFRSFFRLDLSKIVCPNITDLVRYDIQNIQKYYSVKRLVGCHTIFMRKFLHQPPPQLSSLFSVYAMHIIHICFLSIFVRVLMFMTYVMSNAILFSSCVHVYNVYGSVSAGREKWPFNVIFFLKVEPPCDQT